MKSDNLENSHNFGFGKIIIFGEYFVVHGLPALVASLSLKTYAEIQEDSQIKDSSSNNLILLDNRPKAPGFIPSKTVEYKNMCEKILNFFEIKDKNLTVTFSGTLPVTCGGIGASAAAATSFVRAVNSKFNLNLNDEQINQAAFAGESAVHGTPSGIDNTAAVFGGVIKFCKKQNLTPAFYYSRIQNIKPIRVVIIDSGKKTDTKQVVFAVRDFIEKNPEQTKIIFEQYINIFNMGLDALENGNLEKLGECMNENHKLLQELSVSCYELDDIVDQAIALGAFGAKLTGTGRGGLVFALTPEIEQQDLIANYFKALGYFVVKTVVPDIF